MTAFSSGLTDSVRAIAASTSSPGLASPERTSSAWAVASRVRRSSVKSGERPSAGPGVASEQLLQPDGEAVRQLPHPAHREQYARHEGAAVHRIVANRQGLALTAEDHLLVCDQARQAN